MTLIAVALSTLLLATPAELESIRELYASASFDEVLARLESLDTSGLTPEQLAEAHQYRAATLFALGRTEEAELAMEVLVRSAPPLSVLWIDASPRLLTTFSSVRARVLPQLVRELYASAKRAYDDKAPDAQTQFERLRKFLDEPSLVEGPSAAAFADLRIVVNAFLDLGRATAAAPGGAVTTAPPPARSLYTAADAGVIAPKPIKQVLPRPPALASRNLSFVGRAALTVTIAPDGTVERAILTKSIHPLYDALLVEAARQWRYEPARWNGVPVRFVKSVVVNVTEADDLPR